MLHHVSFQNCNDNDPPCPVIIIERFGLEMKKSYRDTQLQLLLSPSLLISSDKLGNRPVKDHHLNQGHLMLSALQVYNILIYNLQILNIYYLY